MAFDPEPPYTHGTPARTGILLCNLGTPDAPDAPSVRRYLAEFLSDPRVVEIPRLLWWPILHGIILRVRPAKSAEKYASIWTPEGSPLKIWTERQAVLLRGYLGERGHQLDIRMAMRYGQPAVASQLAAMRADGVTRVLIVPLYPQYSGTTTASVIDAVSQWTQRVRQVPELRIINRFHDDPAYIQALKASVHRHWMTHGRPDKLVMSFHGVPDRTLHMGDPYHCECHKTARLLAEALGLQKEQWMVTFQSRFGKAKWLEPYTEPTLVKLAQGGTRRVDVMCPGFVGDCLETLEEIQQEAREAFLKAGGEEFGYIPCLNDSHEWIRALADLCEKHMGGWPTQVRVDEAQQELARARAISLGAVR